MGDETAHVTMRVRIGENELEVTGPKEFVEEKVGDFLKKHKEPAGRGAPGSTEAPGQPDQRPVQVGKRLSIGQFFKKVAPSSDVERTLAAGYYLEKYAAADKFTMAELRKAIRDAKVPPPRNPSDTIGKNIKKGLIMSVGEKDGKLAYALTTDGEEAIAGSLRHPE